MEAENSRIKLFSFSFLVDHYHRGLSNASFNRSLSLMKITMVRPGNGNHVGNDDDNDYDYVELLIIGFK